MSYFGLWGVIFWENTDNLLEEMSYLGKKIVILRRRCHFFKKKKKKDKCYFWGESLVYSWEKKPLGKHYRVVMLWGHIMGSDATVKWCYVAAVWGSAMEHPWAHRENPTQEGSPHTERSPTGILHSSSWLCNKGWELQAGYTPPAASGLTCSFPLLCFPVREAGVQHFPASLQHSPSGTVWQSVRTAGALLSTAPQETALRSNRKE